MPFTDSSAPSKLDYLVRAADCYRTALEVRYRGEKETNPFDCALAEWNLADVLFDQHFYMEASVGPMPRLAVLGEAVTAYRAAMEYFIFDDDPDSWLILTGSLVRTLGERAKFSDDEVQTTLLDEARQLGRSALTAIGTKTPLDVSALVKTNLAFVDLYRAKLAATLQEAASLEAEAHELVNAALKDRRREDPNTLNKEALADAQATVGYFLRFRASLATGEPRVDMLKQAAATLREALQSLPGTLSEDSDAKWWPQSVLAETLLQLARQTTIPKDVQQCLEEAKELCRDAMEARIVEQQPESLAWVLGIYAGVLAEQAKHAPASERGALLDEAAFYDDLALAVPNQQNAPEDWAGTRFNCAVLFAQYARLVEADSADKARSYMSQAQQYLINALDVYTSPAFLWEREQALSLGTEIEQYAQTLKVAS